MSIEDIIINPTEETRGQELPLNEVAEAIDYYRSVLLKRRYIHHKSAY
jgi:hypothetical protein